MSEETPKQEKQGPTAPKSEHTPISYFSLYSHASPWDIFLIVVGTISAMINGAILPSTTIFFGDILGALILYNGTPDSRAMLDSAVTDGVIKMLIVGAGTFLFSYIQMVCWMVSGENQTRRIRQLYFGSIMRQEVAWFDKTDTGELTTRMTADMSLIQEGLSDKIGLMIQFTSSFVGGFVIAFIKGWQLALVLCSVFPVMFGAVFIMGKTVVGGSTKSLTAYAGAGAVAQQVLSSIRTVTAFGGQQNEIKRYKVYLDQADSAGISNMYAGGVGVATLQGVIFLIYALAFWYGNTLIPGIMTGGGVVNVFFAIIIGAFSLGNASPHMASVGQATAAGAAVFSTINRKSAIDSCSTEGVKPIGVTGNISFKNIKFHYPSRPDVNILPEFSLEVPAGKTVALVGMSGCGKSTMVKLLERFYDPIEGTILFDGHDIKELNVKWLRQQIGMVSQEPVLFNCSIRDNLRYGLLDEDFGLPEEKICAKIEAVLRQANAWDFVSKLPKGLDTHVGEAGSMLSGGQKQRIAIARAILKNPKILLLDEATSALDAESEKLVQIALDKAAANRTTICIAHRLSTIKNADLIVVMRAGEIIERGTHSELVAKDGVYYSMVQGQKLEGSESNPDTAVLTTEVSSHVPELLAADNSATELKKDKSFVVVKVSKSADGLDKREIVAGETEALMPAQEKPPRGKFMKRFVLLNRPEWGYYVLGALGAAINGVVMPCFAIVFSSILTALGTSQANFWALMFLVLAVAGFTTTFAQYAFFGIAGVKLTTRLRDMCFKALLRQEVGFFDKEENSTGALASNLAEDASLVQGITGPFFGAIIQAASGIIAGLAIAFYACWQLSAVILGLIPVMGAAGYFQMTLLVGFGKKSRKAYEQAGQVACESIAAIRTVLTLTQESRIIEAFKNHCDSPHSFTVKGAIYSSLGFALSQGVPLFAWAVSFFYGSRLIVWGLYGSQAIVQSMFAVIFSSMTAGQVNSRTPDSSKAHLAAIAVCKLLDRTPEIDVTSPEGEKLERITGHANVTDAEFSYPTRKDTKILKGFSIDALPGKTVALVGQSGCGKSTVIALLERWYDVSKGSACVDDIDVRKWNLNNLRSHMSLVGQEPVLFNISIRDNIAYGAIGKIDEEMIYNAAKLANIHGFVTELPQGYDTLVGEKGGQLSGGQKQRIAIARALVRNPKLLLLDEATSALDSESEKLVQDALDAASKGRTTIVIAHRLSTIQNADLIYVVNGGQIVESGTHRELVEKKGEYYSFVSQQALTTVA